MLFNAEHMHSWKFLPEEIFFQILPSALVGEIFIFDVLSSINDYIEKWQPLTH